MANNIAMAFDSRAVDNLVMDKTFTVDHLTMDKTPTVDILAMNTSPTVDLLVMHNTPAPQDITPTADHTVILDLPIVG